jgi:hypothetical protein
MSAKKPVALGLRAQRGGGVVVAVVLETRQPRIVLSSFLATASPDDRLAFEPYHVASEMKRTRDGKPTREAAAAVAEGRKRQDQVAAAGLKAILRKLTDDGCKPVTAALLANRAGWITDVLAYSIDFEEHARVAEGIAVRDALRYASRTSAIPVSEIDEKSLPALASEVLALSPVELDAQLKSLGSEAGKPWRKEQKMACLAAWLSLARTA